ncbi:hypothetical protein M0813_10682 [Anaeramoeba flamelloides]|uniref:Uncharacterized protein n=1 Tax=Anaeramoeba flamelloides TaxID=1746091 RepID=A0ABQ8X1D4_9EUKA|nr:hypothetical protein M0813_10682 [Anaeramoeba flamelloides]
MNILKEENKILKTKKNNYHSSRRKSYTNKSSSKKFKISKQQINKRYSILSHKNHNSNLNQTPNSTSRRISISNFNTLSYTDLKKDEENLANQVKGIQKEIKEKKKKHQEKIKISLDSEIDLKNEIKKQQEKQKSLQGTIEQKTRQLEELKRSSKEEIQKLENNNQLEINLSKENHKNQCDQLKEQIELNQKRITTLLNAIGESNLDYEESNKLYQNEIQTFSQALDSLEITLTNRKKDLRKKVFQSKFYLEGDSIEKKN